MTTNGLNVPNDPIIPFIEGDGTGPDIWAASVRVFDAAVEKAYGGTKKIAWQEVLASTPPNQTPIRRLAEAQKRSQQGDSPAIHSSAR